MAILVRMLSRMLRFAILLAVVAAVVEAIRRLAQPETAETAPAPTPWTPLEPTPGQDNGAAAAAEAESVPAAEASSPTSGPVDTADTQTDEDTSTSAPATWVDPDAEGACPASHPLKAKDSSKIVHQPGGLSYDRTHADRCYVDLAAAEADGYRAAKR